MADSLYARYMKVAATSHVHEATCKKCSPDARCDAGQRLHEAFTQLQDTYLAQQKKRG